MCHMVGYSREELLAMNPFDLLDEPSQALFRSRITRWLSGERPDRNVELKARAKDGHMLDTVLNVTFTTDAIGRPLGATVGGYDITDRKRMEDELRKSRDELEASSSGKHRRTAAKESGSCRILPSLHLMISMSR